MSISYPLPESPESVLQRWYRTGKLAKTAMDVEVHRLIDAEGYGERYARIILGHHSATRYEAQTGNPF